MRRSSLGDIPPMTSNNHIGNNSKHKNEIDKDKGGKQSTGCFGCLSKRNTPKCDLYDETLNNAKDRCTAAESNQPPRDNNNISDAPQVTSIVDHVGSLPRNFNIINNFNHPDTIDLFDKETPILNNLLDNSDPIGKVEQHRNNLCSSEAVPEVPRRFTITEAVVIHRSESIERCLSLHADSKHDNLLIRDNLLRRDNSMKRDNVDQLTTDSGISSPPCIMANENIYDSVRHFSKRKWKSLNEDSPPPMFKGEENLENVEFHHRIGREMIKEMESESFDTIHYESYRTAQKLNFIRQKLKLHNIDIYRVMNSFKESNIRTTLNVSELYEVAHRIYSAHNQHSTTISTTTTTTNPSSLVEVHNKMASLLVGWLLHVYDPKRKGEVESFSARVALSSICAGPLFEKLKYIFKYLYNGDGALNKEGLQKYLHAVLSLPSSLSLNRTSPANLTNGIDVFVNEMMKGEVPSCLNWLQTLHNLIRAEKAIHPVECASCHMTNFPGLLYKCLECSNYHMCQDCFWRGFTSEGHIVQHKVKEYMTTQVTLDLEVGKYHTLSSSNHFNRIPTTTTTLTTASSSSTSTTTTTTSTATTCNNNKTTTHAGRRAAMIPLASEDDEHKLISRYVHRLKCSSLNMDAHDPAIERQNLVFELEAKNREIQKEIHRLKCHQMQQKRDRRSANLVSESESSDEQLDPNLLKEIRLLRQHQGELEARMKGLQGSRRGLMQQLEGLMRKLKTQSSLSPSACSPRSYCDSPAFTYPVNLPYIDSLETHHSLPLHQSFQPQHPIPPLPSHFHHQQQQTLTQTLLSQPPSLQQPLIHPPHLPPQPLLPQPPHPSLSPRFPHQTQKQQLFPQSSPKSPSLNPVSYSMGSEFHQAFAFPSTSNLQGFQSAGLRQDLLLATDKVTDAMSSLVLELNTEESSDSDHERRKNDSALLKSPGRRNQGNHILPADARNSLSSQIAASVERQADLKRGGSLREADVNKSLRRPLVQEESSQGKQEENESNVSKCRDSNLRSEKTEEPKRRWSNR